MRPPRILGALSLLLLLAYPLGAKPTGGGEPPDPFLYPLPVKKYAVIDLSGTVQGSNEVQNVAIGNDGQAAFYFLDGDDVKIALWKNGAITAGPTKTGNTFELLSSNQQVINTFKINEYVHLNSRGNMAGNSSGRLMFGSWAFGDQALRRQYTTMGLQEVMAVTENDEVITFAGYFGYVQVGSLDSVDFDAEPTSSWTYDGYPIISRYGFIIAQQYDGTFQYSYGGSAWEDFADLPSLGEGYHYEIWSVSDAHQLFAFDPQHSKTLFYDGTQSKEASTSVDENYQAQVKIPWDQYAAYVYDDNAAVTWGQYLADPKQKKWEDGTFVLDLDPESATPEGKWPIARAQVPEAWDVSLGSVSNSSGLHAGLAKKTIDDQGNPIPLALQYTHAVLLVPITISFQAHGDNEPLSDNKKKILDGSGGLKDEWMPGRGKRIFPDKKTGSDSTPRDAVDVKVETGMPNTKVYLLALDVDDPTMDEVDSDPDTGQKHIIDDNDETTGPDAGEDNRSGRPEFTPGGTFTTNAEIECLTDADGIAKVSGALPQLRVSKKPGDNYRIAVALLKHDDLDNLQTLTKSGAYYVPSGDAQPTGFNGVVGPMLTVWRKIHVEQDTMMAPPNPKPAPDHQVATNGAWGEWSYRPDEPRSQLTCDVPQSVAANFYGGGRVVAGSTDYQLNQEDAHGAGTHLVLKFDRALTEAERGTVNTSSIQLYDDDDKPLPSGWVALLPHENLINNEVKAAFQSAYIDLNDQPTDYNSTDVPFVLNMPASRSTLGSDAPSKASIPSTNEYWGCTVVAGYQDFADGGDLDPKTDIQGGFASTLTVNSRGVSVVFLEMIREISLYGGVNPTVNDEAFKRKLWQTLAHEIGHDAPSGLFSNDHGEGGLMNPDEVGVPGSQFTPYSIRRFRNADHWRK